VFAAMLAPPDWLKVAGLMPTVPPDCVNAT
jgi:hypothetical protein